MRLPEVSEGEGFGRMSTEGIKAFVRVRIRKHPAIVKEVEDLPDYLPATSANVDRIVIYWELVTAALEEE